MLNRGNVGRPPVPSGEALYRHNSWAPFPSYQVALAERPGAVKGAPVLRGAADLIDGEAVLHDLR
jgi:hypothetical protein